MTRIVIPEALWPQIAHRDPAGRESAGVAIATVAGSGSNARILVREIHIPDADGYTARGEVHASLSPAFVAQMTAEARRSDCSVVFFHTHPSSRDATFSETDDLGERDLAAFLSRRIPDRAHASIVIGIESHRARLLGTDTPCDIEVVGKTVRRWYAKPGSRADSSDGRFDRQIRVFGRSSQAVLQRLRVAVVGLGGTGSVIAQQLAHLGVTRFLLVDPDVVEASNLPRLVGATQKDADRTPKVDVAERVIRGINPLAEVDVHKASIVLEKEAAAVSGADVAFCCTDNHGSRHVLNQLAYQFYMPVIDVGVAIASTDNRVTHIFGRTQMLAPGLPCLTCLQVLDPHQIRRDLMSDFERQRDPYFIGASEPEPAVMSLNGTVSSMAVTMLLGVYAGVPVDSRYQLYDAMRGVVRSVSGSPAYDCVTCSLRGAFGRGDSWPLPGRSV